MISILDYGMGNLGSVKNMLLRIGADAEFVHTESEVLKATKIILPGVGSFDAAMRNLDSRGLSSALNQRVILDKVPLLGICLGMQLLMENSEEGQISGLGWIPGTCRRFRTEDGSGLKVPHMGWNTAKIIQPHTVVRGLDDESEFYFVHSYYVESSQKEFLLGETEHGLSFHSALCRDNIVAVQFHPEKSLKHGMVLMKNFSEWTP